MKTNRGRSSPKKRKKAEERKKDRTDRMISLRKRADNGASLKAVGLATFFRHIVTRRPFEWFTLVPPAPRHALCLISRGGLRKSPRDNRDFILERAIRPGARNIRILSASFFSFFIDIDLT